MQMSDLVIGASCIVSSVDSMASTFGILRHCCVIASSLPSHKKNMVHVMCTSWQPPSSKLPQLSLH